MEHVHDKVKLIAANGYLLLPLFLAFVAAVCMLIATIRKTLTSGMAAAFAALGGVVVVGTAAIAIHHGRPPRHDPQAAAAGLPQAAIALPHSPLGGVPGAKAPAIEENVTRRELQNDVERLDAENRRLRAELRAALGKKPEGTPGAGARAPAALPPTQQPVGAPPAAAAPEPPAPPKEKEAEKEKPEAPKPESRAEKVSPPAEPPPAPPAADEPK